MRGLANSCCSAAWHSCKDASNENTKTQGFRPSTNRGCKQAPHGRLTASAARQYITHGILLHMSGLYRHACHANLPALRHPPDALPSPQHRFEHCDGGAHAVLLVQCHSHLLSVPAGRGGKGQRAVAVMISQHRRQWVPTGNLIVPAHLFRRKAAPTESLAPGTAAAHSPGALAHPCQPSHPCHMLRPAAPTPRLPLTW